MNETDINKKIYPGDKINIRSTKDYINNYSIYNKESLENIVSYVISLLKNNNVSSLEKHYEKFEIKKRYSMKGIYIYYSYSESMVEDILQIFLDIIGKIPIAQNILFISKETSYEEIQSFLNRAILCRYNTLFVIEINESFSDYQQRDLNKIIDGLLTYKNENFNKIEKKNIEKFDTSEYMDSCLAFICNIHTQCSLNYIIKLLHPKELKLNELYHSLNNNIFIESKFEDEMLNSTIVELYNNTHIITSEICGLGKTTKIKTYIRNKNKQYIYLPIGGNINKNILFQKLEAILSKIKTLNNYNDIAIHLDLYENNETSLMNEFLFCFLITKFYSNNENIIYVPNSIEIYIEVPNCFESFLSKYKILESFEIENFKFEKKPE